MRVSSSSSCSSPSLEAIDSTRAVAGCRRRGLARLGPRHGVGEREAEEVEVGELVDVEKRCNSRGGGEKDGETEGGSGDCRRHFELEQYQ